MEVEKLKNWLDLTKQYATESFWKEVLQQQNNRSNTSAHSNQPQDRFPHCDLYESNGYLYVQAELPGIQVENIQIILQGKSLILKGHYATLKPTIKYYLKERPDKEFERIIRLPYKVHRQSIETNIQNGLLTVLLPILPEEEAVPITLNLHQQNEAKPY
ncbi:Hsp20/alpha crystallin family protein [Bacillus massilinigeriensis]|uniref:Hsp20/alpha crystallin family protein n=1 Tax=Bacillus mediterraneensis TaxID=1805474 RepID=UPI0008F84167|nr:Hsp20/alpha crystallin family protein [Bacillus mediterraneensis]